MSMLSSVHITTFFISNAPPLLVLFSTTGNHTKMFSHHGHELSCTFASLSFADVSPAVQFYSHLLQFASALLPCLVQLGKLATAQQF